MKDKVLLISIVVLGLATSVWAKCCPKDTVALCKGECCKRECNSAGNCPCPDGQKFRFDSGLQKSVCCPSEAVASCNGICCPSKCNSEGKCPTCPEGQYPIPYGGLGKWGCCPNADDKYVEYGGCCPKRSYYPDTGYHSEGCCSNAAKPLPFTLRTRTIECCPEGTVGICNDKCCKYPCDSEGKCPACPEGKYPITDVKDGKEGCCPNSDDGYISATGCCPKDRFASKKNECCKEGTAVKTASDGESQFCCPTDKTYVALAETGCCLLSEVAELDGKERCGCPEGYEMRNKTFGGKFCKKVCPTTVSKCSIVSDIYDGNGCLIMKRFSCGDLKCKSSGSNLINDTCTSPTVNPPDDPTDPNTPSNPSTPTNPDTPTNPSAQSCGDYDKNCYMCVDGKVKPKSPGRASTYCGCPTGTSEGLNSTCCKGEYAYNSSTGRWDTKDNDCMCIGKGKGDVVKTDELCKVCVSETEAIVVGLKTTYHSGASADHTSKHADLMLGALPQCCAFVGGQMCGSHLCITNPNWRCCPADESWFGDEKVMGNIGGCCQADRPKQHSECYSCSGEQWVCRKDFQGCRDKCG